MSETETQGARGYSWPPFEPGNTAAVKHGTRSLRLIRERADEIRDMLLTQYPYLAEPQFAASILRYCRLEARARMLDTYVTEKAQAEGIEAVKPYLLAEATRADLAAQKAGQDCGLDATGHARIAERLGLATAYGRSALARSGPPLGERGRALRDARGRLEGGAA